MKRSILLCLSITVLLFGTTSLYASDCQQARELTREAGRVISVNPGKAERLLQDALGLCYESSSIRYNLAVVKMLLDKPAEARVYLVETVKKKPDHAKANNLLARIAMENGDEGLALEYARTAVGLEPDNSRFQATLDAVLDVDSPPKTGASKPDAVAVVIGNKIYKDRILAKAPVKYAINDAKVMKDYLVQTLGYDERNIIYLEDANMIDFLKVFGDDKDYHGQLYSRVRMFASSIFVFYSGHGAPDTNTKKAFIVPSDADPSVIRFTGYPLDTLKENLAKIGEEKKVDSVIVAMDACFSGGYNDGMLIDSASPIFIETDTTKLSSDKAVMLSSSRKDQISSWYPDKEHGLFTYFFLKGIKEAAQKGKTLTVSDMERYLMEPDRVGDYAWRLYNREQTPDVQGNRDVELYRP
jgi:hypothetical protein